MEGKITSDAAFTGRRNRPYATRALKIAYLNDQLLPTTETDTEQIMQTVSNLGKINGNMHLILPSRWGRDPLTAATLTSYYQVPRTFRLQLVKSLFPSNRVFEKIAHPLSVFIQKLTRQADIIYSRNLPTVALALLLTDKPVVYETYRPWPNQIPALIPFLKQMALHDRMLGIIAHSRIAADSFIDIGFAKKRVLVAYNGYNPDIMSPVLGKTIARKIIGIPEAGPVAVYSGHISSGKGLHTILDVAGKLPEIQFLLVGSTMAGSVECRAKNMANVKVYNWQPFDKVVPFLYSADFLLIPPTRYPLEVKGHTVLPLKTYLYMAAGRAIVGPNTPDLREILTDGKNACLVEPDNTNAFATALRHLLKDGDRMKRLAQNALRNAHHYTLDQRAKKIYDFLHQRLRNINLP